MKISNLNVYKRVSNYKLKISALSLAGLLAIFGLTGCVPAKENGQEVYQQTVSKTYLKGEHIIILPIDQPTKKIIQYTYHPGYKCVGISTGSFGQSFRSFGDAYLLYVNECDVKCSTIVGKDGTMSFSDFGIPIDFEYEEKEDVEEKTFEIGEHILSMPIDNPKDHVGDYPFFEGYEVVGIATSNFGKSFKSYGGGCILYVNIEPIKCKATYNENGEASYASFGTPISKTLVKE